MRAWNVVEKENLPLDSPASTLLFPKLLVLEGDKPNSDAP